MSKPRGATSVRKRAGSVLQTTIRAMFLQAWLEQQHPFQGRDLAWLKTEFNKVYPNIIADAQWPNIMKRVPDLIGYDIYAGHGQIDVSIHLYSWRMPLLPQQKQQTKILVES